MGFLVEVTSLFWHEIKIRLLLMIEKYLKYISKKARSDEGQNVSQKKTKNDIKNKHFDL